jgi:CBS domain-containing protein
MATVLDLLAIKGTHVFSIGPEATILDTALLMNEHKIGSLVVLNGGQIVGIITERDILQRVVVTQRHPARTTVREVMTNEVLCCEPSTCLDEVRGVLKHRRVRHLPVVEGNELRGLVSIGDLNAYDARDHEVTIHALQEYIYGRV